MKTGHGELAPQPPFKTWWIIWMFGLKKQATWWGKMQTHCRLGSAHPTMAIFTRAGVAALKNLWQIPILPFNLYMKTDHGELAPQPPFKTWWIIWMFGLKEHATWWGKMQIHRRVGNAHRFAAQPNMQKVGSAHPTIAIFTRAGAVVKKL